MYKKLIIALVGLTFTPITFTGDADQKAERALLLQMQAQIKKQQKNPLSRKKAASPIDGPILERKRSGSSNSTKESVKIMDEQQHPDQEKIAHLFREKD